MLKKQCARGYLFKNYLNMMIIANVETLNSVLASRPMENLLSNFVLLHVKVLKELILKYFL